MLLVSTFKTRLATLLRQHGLLRRYDLRAYMASQAQVRIIVGAGGDRYEDWIATDKEMLDLLRAADWAYYFESNSVDAILAEHVWEHLDRSGAIVAAQNCFKYLKPGGYIRVAVPDGLHPDEGYIDYVKPGGWGGKVQMIITFCIHTERWKQSLHRSDLRLCCSNILMNAGLFIIRNGLRLTGLSSGLQNTTAEIALANWHTPRLFWMPENPKTRIGEERQRKKRTSV